MCIAIKINNKSTDIMLEEMETLIKSPSIEYRGCPFWSLNDTLEPSEMIRQVEEFHKAGMGGFFLHSRVGLMTEYLSEAWFEALEAAIKKAEELGMQAWLYDEDKWPSGYAGGRVPLGNPEFRSKVLARLPESETIPKGSELIKNLNGWNYFIYTAKMGEPWFNGACWVDLMNPDAVRAFINCTHEKYRERFGKYFGTVIPGMFTDEPIMRQREGWTQLKADYVPYSSFLRERYERDYSESPFKHLPELFEDTLDAEEYRYRYWRCAAEQFTEAYTKQVADWCTENKLMLTGHFMYEDSIEAQCRWIGAAMPHYRYMQLPGIDHLGLNINNPLTAKQCSSVVNQLNKRAGLSEMYGCSGQNMTFEDREWIAGRHAALGIDFICHHLSLYSMRGCRKRDYPPTFSFHQPYWEDNALLEEKQARLTYLLRNSKAQIDLLVIHPVESGWRLMRGAGADNRIKKLDSELAMLTDKLINSHQDFDFGDESMIADLGKIERGKFSIGQMKYSVVIVPPIIKLRDSTELLLRQFAESGGQVLRLETADNIKTLAESAFSNIPSEVMVYCRKLDEQNSMTCFFNSSRKQSFKLAIAEKSIELDLSSGKENVIKSAVELAPAETRCFLKIVEGKPGVEPEYDILNLGNEWKLTRHNPNTLILDFAQYSIDGEKWSSPEPLIGLKEKFDKQQYTGNLFLRYSFSNNSNLRKAELAVETSRFLKSVSINDEQVTTNGTCYFDSILLNYDAPLISGDNIVELEYNFMFGDPASLEDVERRYGTEIETIYLTGDFGVKGNINYPEELPEYISHDSWNTDLSSRRVAKLENPCLIDPQNSCDGNLIDAGLAFYAGTITLNQKLVLKSPLPTILEFAHLDAISCQVKVNGIKAGTMFRRPWRLDISGLLQEGDNQIELLLKNSLRNLLGPHHHGMGELSSVGPYSFTSRDFKSGKFTPEPNWSLPENRCQQKSWTDDYFIVRFGLDSGIKIFYK
jgi:hypothetical protein